MTTAELIAVRRSMFASFERAVRDLAILTPAEELDDLFNGLMTKIEEIRSVAGGQSKGGE